MSSIPALVAVREVSKRFGAVLALDRVSLTLQAGERVAFVGANGSGKTTLMRAILGLLQMEGQVEIAGVDVRHKPAVALSQVSYIPQVAPPLDAPVRELVRAVTGLYGGDGRKVAELAGVLGVEFERIAGTRMRDLSGGTKQKVLAALALAADAPILVCDEPTANLDQAAREAFFGLVARRPQDGLLVLCSHRSEEVRQMVDRVVELGEGRVLRDDRIERALLDRALCHVTLVLASAPEQGTERWLTEGGYAPLGPLRWRRACPQADKLRVVTEALAHAGPLVDLQVVDAEGWGGQST